MVSSHLLIFYQGIELERSKWSLQLAFVLHAMNSHIKVNNRYHGRGYFRTETNGHLIAENRAQSYTDNYIAQHNSPGKSALAHVQSRVQGQHKMQWSLWFNQAYQSKYSASDWNRVAQHEIGHVYGLKDLSHSSNRNRLMYKSIIRNKGGLTANEKAGLGIIWRY